LKKVLLIFLDGVGIGLKDKKVNPFFSRGFKTFDSFFGQAPSQKNSLLRGNNKFIFPIDARLGIEGLPQSGTGQATIFTGVNAAAIANKHFGPFPHSSSIKIIEEKNIFSEAKARGLLPFFANAYPGLFFDYLQSGKKRINVTALMAIKSGVGLRKVDELERGDALSNEITNYRWVENLKIELKIITPRKAAQRLIKLALKYDLTLFEFYLTDHLGHWRLKEQFDKIWFNLDDFLFALLSNIPENLTIFIFSDHGNIEDLSVKTHTLNPALGLTAGEFAEKLFVQVKSLVDIKDAVLNLF